MEFGEHLLDLATRTSPLVKETLQRFGDAPLAELIATVQPRRVPAVQPRDDLWAALHALVATYHGTDVATEAVGELRADPVVPTANHFGVDTFADSVQGTLLFALRPRPDGAPRRTVVVLGFGSVSLNNLTYPMGLRLYEPRAGVVEALPQRLPVFPHRLRHCTVGAAPPFDAGMVARARARLDRMHGDGAVGGFGHRAAAAVLDGEYAPAATAASHGHQSTAVNAGLWRRAFVGGAPARLVQVPIEPLCARLLEADLADPGSLVAQLFFVPAVRRDLLARLDGARACWRREDLTDRLAGRAGVRSGGTVFFWGLLDDGRRVPLALQERSGVAWLAGVDDRGRPVECPFTPDDLVAALRSGRLTPSLFTCFATLAFARGLSCVGGYYQVEYLPVMQRAVVAALAAVAECRPAADLVAQVPTDLCLAGVQPVARVLPDGGLIPAGPVEIGGAGGLTAADLARCLSIPVRNAYLIAFPELLHHLVPPDALPAGWTSRLVAENGGLREVVRLECR